MSFHFSPHVVTNGLTLCLDAANPRSYNTLNLAINSEALDIWSNNGGGIIVTANAEIAPDGTQTADRLAQSPSTIPAERRVSCTTRTYIAGVTYTISIWLKKVSGADAQPTITLWLNPLAGASVVGTITNNWVRYTRTFTPTSTINLSSGLVVGWGTSGQPNDFVFAAWGYQIEVGPSATEYIPSTLVWSDLSRGANNGLLSGDPIYNTENGGSIRFDGTDDCVNWSSNPLSSLTNITYDCWFRFIPPNKNTFLISSSNFRVYQQDNAMWFIAFLPFGGTIRNIQFNWTFNQGWNNLVYSFNGTTSFVYLNGNQVSTIAGGGTSTQANLRISGRSTPGGSEIRGDIASVKIYNRALSATEISQNYLAVKNRFGQ